MFRFSRSRQSRFDSEDSSAPSPVSSTVPVSEGECFRLGRAKIELHLEKTAITASSKLQLDRILGEGKRFDMPIKCERRRKTHITYLSLFL